MGGAENAIDTVHWGIALFSEYIFLVTTLFSRKGYV